MAAILSCYSVIVRVSLPFSVDTIGTGQQRASRMECERLERELRNFVMETRVPIFIIYTIAIVELEEYLKHPVKEDSGASRIGTPRKRLNE